MDTLFLKIQTTETTKWNMFYFMWARKIEFLLISISLNVIWLTETIRQLLSTVRNSQINDWAFLQFFSLRQAPMPVRHNAWLSELPSFYFYFLGYEVYNMRILLGMW